MKTSLGYLVRAGKEKGKRGTERLEVGRQGVGGTEGDSERARERAREQENERQREREILTLATKASSWALHFCSPVPFLLLARYDS